MGKFTKIPINTFKSIQTGAGMLFDKFDPETGAYEEDALLGATSGGISVEVVPSFTDFGEDIDNCPKNTKELKRLDGWEIKASGDFTTMTAKLAKRLLNGDVAGSKITPRRDLQDTDFFELWWVADYSDVNTGAKAGHLAIHMSNVLSTGGLNIQSTDKEKGKFSFEFTAHTSIAAQDIIPLEYYVEPGTAEAGA